MENIVRHALRLRGKLAELAIRKKKAVDRLLRDAKGCGAVITHEVLAWIGQAPTVDHLCVCRRCGREMG